MIAMQNVWLVNSGKTNAATKTQIKKDADTEKKALKKIEKAKEKDKTRSKKKVLGIRKLTASNHKAQIISFIALLLDPPTASNIHLHLIESTLTTFFVSPSSATLLATAHLAC